VRAEGDLKIERPTASDWVEFRCLAAAEGWRVPARELELYAGPLADSAFVLRGKECRGWVTTVAHERSGWLGNLLVPPAFRGWGYGARLFDHALEVLDEQGCRSVWLTASEQGRPIYERRGFVAVDRIVRWVGTGVAGGEAVPSAGTGELYAADREVWGESRRPLLEWLARGGRLASEEGTVLLLQAGTELQVLGPWYARESCPRRNRQVLSAALAGAGSGAVVADVLASAPVGNLLAAAGFRRVGECALLVRGADPGIQRSGLVSLASLGSMG
jgi:GNAT superfamily N-acetyltransferase